MKAHLLTVFFVLLLTMSPLAKAITCRDMVAMAPQGVTLTAERHLPDGQSLTPFCLLSGQINNRIGIDGQSYALKFELRLPDHWQGRFAYQFNDKNDGIVAPALGKVTGLTPAQYAINRGFAVFSSNGGHDALPISTAGLSGSALFGRDPQARLDYGYAAVRKLYPLARSLIQNYYGQGIRYSYGIGASNGGRMGIVAGSRHGQMFDGLLLASPSLNAPQAALQSPWDAQVLAELGTNRLNHRDLTLVSQKVMAACDGLDGIRDGLIFAFDQCQRAFKPSQMACHGQFDRDCLAPEKVAAIMRMYQGPSNSYGQRLYTDWLYDTGIGTEAWQRWKIHSSVRVWQGKSASSILGAAALANIFMTPPVDVGGTPDSLMRFLLAFDFDKDAAKIHASTGVFMDSAMTFMNPPYSKSPALLDFQRHGGKMIVFHGTSDPVFSIKETIAWYQGLTQGGQRNVSDFIRFYPVPGMLNGRGGIALDRFDSLLPLMQWVEANQAPGTIVATAQGNNPALSPHMYGLQRPLCPYPTTTKYRQGDVRLASSFACLKEP